MMPIATGLSLAALYDEQEEAAPDELASSSSRPRWTLAHDYQKVTPSELKWELVLGRAWNEVAAHLSPRNININTVKPATQSQTASLAHIMKSSYDAPRLLVSNFLDEMSASFSWIEADIKRCMQHLEVAHLSRGSNVRLTEVMNALFDKLYRWEKEWGAGMKWIDGFYKPPIAPSKSYCQTLFRNHYQALLFDILPSEAFHHHLKNYFRSTLPPLRPLHHPSNRAYEFELPNRYLYRIGILPKYASMLADVAYEQLGRVVRGDWDEPVRTQDGVDSMDEDQGEEEGREWKRRMLRDLQVVVRRDILGWFFGYIEAGGSKDEHRKHNIETRIKHRLQMEFYEYRCQQMFDIIVNFPASLPALADMQDCDALTPPLKRTKLAPVLNESINQRLLHPGAETKDIIRGYILIIKALRVVDPSGVLLHSISQPIKAYLKSRSDAVASIVSMLVETDELADESDQIRGIREINVRHELAEEWIDQKWDPEPIDAAPEFRAKKPNDILSILVGMYDSRDVIVTEIQMWLARQLLNVKNYDYDEHFAKVETLKKRFGDTTLQVCEIMLKDMTDSKRLNAQVQRVQENQLEPIILSHHYWPSVAGKRIRLPRALRRMQKQYSTAFNKVKQDKHMKFFNMLGLVSLTIEVGDRSVTCNATPLQAAVLDAVSKKGQCTWQQISDRIGIDDEKVIKHALNHWINHSILHSSNDGSYSASDKPEVIPEDPSLVLLDTAEAIVLETPLATRADMETHRWTEIQRLLAGGASFNTFILHRLLSRDPTYANSKESLERFLGMTARTGLIETTTNGWRLPKVST